MTQRPLVLVLVCVLLMAGCGGKSGSSSSSAGPGGTTTTQTHFAKTKFVLHAGLAFGLFHHYIYKPFKAGDFSHPLRHKLAILDAVLAAKFIEHEVTLARQDARSSKLLSKVVLPLTGVVGTMVAIRALVLHHSSPASAVNGAQSSISTVEGDSSAAGQPIRETTAGAPAGL